MEERWTWNIFYKLFFFKQFLVNVLKSKMIKS
jgi:hypothetical protein